MNFDSLWQAVIRPYRQEYHPSDLGLYSLIFSYKIPSKIGPEILITPSFSSKRRDFFIINPRNLKLQCSFFELFDQKTRLIKLKTPCLIYLHSNTGSRIEALSLIQPILSQGISLFCFDFAGTGLSQGKYISLGFFEKDDVSTVVNHLKNEEKIEKIAIWGRSMGATSALLYCLKEEENYGKNLSEKPKKKLSENSKETAKNLPLFTEKSLIDFMVLDSPFCSLKALVEELAEAKTKLPLLIIKGIVSLINSSVKKEAGFSLENVDLSENLKEIQVPLVILAAKNDKIVKFWQCEKIYQRLSGEKQLLELDLEHNEARKKETIEKIARIIKEKLEKNCWFSNFNDKYHLFKGKPEKMLIKARENYCGKDSEFEIRPRSSTISGNNSNIANIANIANLTTFVKNSKRENSLIIAHKVEKKEISEDLSINYSFSWESEGKEESFRQPVMKKPISSRILPENNRNVEKKRENNKENTNFSSFGEFFTIKRREDSKKSQGNENKIKKKAACSTTPSFKSKLMKILRENRIVDSQKPVFVKEFTLY